MADTFTTRLNITKQELGKTNWKAGEDNFKDKVDQLAAQYLCVHIGGVAIDEDIVFNDFQFDEPVTLTKISLFAREGPSGSPLTLDILKNDIEQNRLATIATGTQSIAADITDANFAVNERLGLKVKAVGSGNAGAEITAVIHYHVQSI